MTMRDLMRQHEHGENFNVLNGTFLAAIHFFVLIFQGR